MIEPMRAARPCRTLLPYIALIVLCSACSEVAQLPLAAGVGPDPTLPAPRHTLIPTVKLATPKGWPAGTTPTAAQGTTVAAFARQLDHPRWLYLLPNGDVLVAETNAPPKPDDSKGLKGWIMRRMMRKVGAGTASANRITLLRDADGDGVAELRSVFLSGLNSPFGMALVGHDLYVANSDAIWRFAYVDGQTQISAPGTKLLDLPAGRINHHWTKNILASRDGEHLYATVGSNSNVGENGVQNEDGRAAVWQIDLRSGAHRVYATGLRNPNGLGWEPHSGALWAVVNERDELGSDLVPDYMTALTEGGFYGWPYSYFGQHVDERVKPERPDLVAKAIVPDYALGPHTASLGLAFSAGTTLPPAFAEGVFIGQHGSWNRRPFSGYKVIFVPFASGRPAGQPVDVLSGFLSDDGAAFGRPVGVILDRQGALLVADDVGNVVWRVTAASTSSAAR
jgi:glucose/arabinose dehydrogenase